MHRPNCLGCPECSAIARAIMRDPFRQNPRTETLVVALAKSANERGDLERAELARECQGATLTAAPPDPYAGIRLQAVVLPPLLGYAPPDGYALARARQEARR